MTVQHRVPGIDPLWLTEGRMDNMSMPLRRTIEEAERTEGASDEEEDI
jgi:hypothetical protein